MRTRPQAHGGVVFWGRDTIRRIGREVCGVDNIHLDTGRYYEEVVQVRIDRHGSNGRTDGRNGNH
jgi:hypothetical protein